jgi:Prealbumin-like fold domain
MRKLFSLSILAVLLVLFSCFVLAETESTPKPDSETGLEGVISVGPIQGGPTRQGVPDSRPLANVEFVIEKENNAVASFKTDDQGRFRISLPPGHYSISRKDWKASIGSYGPFEVDVAAGQMKRVQWNCDTGMR